jgi:hypothetical protein
MTWFQEYIKLLARMGIVARSEIRQLFEDFWQAEVGWTSEHIALTEAQKDAADVAPACGQTMMEKASLERKFTKNGAKSRMMTPKRASSD